MRRMMHAAAIVFLLVPSANAQVSSVRKLPALPIRDRSVLASPSDVSETNESVSVGPVAEDAVDHHGPTPAISPYMPHDSGRPFSQLAVNMNCIDASPNLWCGYGAERAAITARVMRHVDGQCHCYSCRSSLHAHSCGGVCGTAGCGDTCGVGASGCGVVRNRYKQPFSTFYATPSSDCGMSCGKSCIRAFGCSRPGCTVQAPCSSCQAHSSGGAASTGDLLGSTLHAPTTDVRPIAITMVTPMVRNAQTDTVRLTPAQVPNRR